MISFHAVTVYRNSSDSARAAAHCSGFSEWRVTALRIVAAAPGQGCWLNAPGRTSLLLKMFLFSEHAADLSKP